MHAPQLAGDGFALLPLCVDDVTETYVGWLNDPDVMRHTMAGSSQHTVETTQAYVQANIDDPQSILWRIMVDRIHIGNLRLSQLAPGTVDCDIAIILGAATARGHGLGPKVIRLATEYAMTKLGRDIVQAVISSANVSSLRAFERAGYAVVSRQPGYFMLDGKPKDGVWMINRRNKVDTIDG